MAGVNVFGEGLLGGEALVWREVRPTETPDSVRRERPMPCPLKAGESRPARGYISAAAELPGRVRASIGTARDFVAATLKIWGIPRAVCDDLVLITSELTTNSVWHAPGELMRVELVLSYDGTAEQVCVLVADEGPGGFPWPSYVGDTDVPDLDRAAGGRGLFLVSAFSTQCGTGTHAGGTAVWAQIDLSPHLAATPMAETSPSSSGHSPHGTVKDGDDDALRAHPQQ